MHTVDGTVSTGDLTGKQHAFCQLVAAGSALNVAYRETHEVGDGTKRETVNECASRLAKRCAPYIAALRAASDEKVSISTATLRMRQLDIATAVPLVHVKRYNCRHCYADPPKATQYDDMAHWLDTLVEYEASLKSPKPFRKPVCGGFGYDPFAPPNPRCRACRGVGEAFLYGPVDTTQLEGAQLAAYAGASIDARTGTIEIHQHDAQAAAQELHRMVPGAIAPKQGESKSTVEHLHRVVPAELTVEEAMRLHDEAIRRQQPVAVITQESKVPPA